MSTTFYPSLPPSREYKRKILKETLRVSQFIYQAGEYDWLRKEVKTIAPQEVSTLEFQQKVMYVHDCLKKYRRITKKGRGIAAVQVGIPESFFVVYRKYPAPKVITFINPSIIKKSKERYRYPEMCMSCNGLVASVVRPAWVEFLYLDEKGKQQLWKIKDDTEQGRMENRIVQHEIDHLHGILNIDKVKSSDLVFEQGENQYANAVFQKII